MKNLSPTFEQISPLLSKKLDVIAHFLTLNLDLAPRVRGGSEFGTDLYWDALAAKFTRAREPRRPGVPATVPDSMVGIVLEEYFSFDANALDRISSEHSISMAAEGIIGDLLERYIASVLESHDWVWCSGEVVKKVDFLVPQIGEAGKFIPLQIKNRDNSENSSSSSIRDGTAIIKWFRTFSRTGETNWGAFPEMVESASLSEDAFQAFARTYLRSLKL